MPSPTCPCGTGRAYDGCCGPLHDNVREASTAEEVMRARYAAYALGHENYLFRSWHPRTRPRDLLGGSGGTWLGLTVLDTEAGAPDDAAGVVEFEARWAGPAGPEVLHERSRFTRRAGRWVYLDGEHGA